MRIKTKAYYNDAHQEVAAGLSASILSKDCTPWRKGETYYTWLCIPNDLTGIRDLVLSLQILSDWVRSRVLVENRLPIWKISVK